MTERTLEGWVPSERDDLAEVIESAFDYRGDVTLVHRDGREIVGYLFNRNADVPQPFVQMFPAASDDVITIAYVDIRAIHFTGRDTAAGNSYAAWRRRREVEKSSREDA